MKQFIDERVESIITYAIVTAAGMLYEYMHGPRVEEKGERRERIKPYTPTTN